MIEATIKINEEKVIIDLIDNGGQVLLVDSEKISDSVKAVYIFYKNRQIEAVSLGLIQNLKFDKYVQITPSWDIDVNYLAEALIENFNSRGYSFDDLAKIPAKSKKPVFEYADKIILILDKFNLNFEPADKKTPAKKKPAKAQHRFDKTLTDMPFYVDYEGARAEVYWIKRNEMLIKKGAVMKKEPPLNKDGSLGFSARFGIQLREENSSAYRDFVTTEDIILKSVNEVGLFLYFGGTNSWLHLKNKEGQTIDELTIVK